MSCPLKPLCCHSPYIEPVTVEARSMAWIIILPCFHISICCTCYSEFAARDGYDSYSLLMDGYDTRLIWICFYVYFHNPTMIDKLQASRLEDWKREEALHIDGDSKRTPHDLWRGCRPFPTWKPWPATDLQGCHVAANVEDHLQTYGWAVKHIFLISLVDVCKTSSLTHHL